MIKQISYIFLLIFIVSCGNEGKKKVRKPDSLISKDKMVNIIYDMSLLSAAKGVNRKLLEQNGVSPENYIYNKHGIDSAKFAESNEYYAFDLDAYEEIYKNVKFKLEKDKKDYTNLIQIEQKQKDSLGKELRKNRDSLRNERELKGIKLERKPIINRKKEKVKPTNRLKNVDSLKKSRNQPI